MTCKLQKKKVFCDFMTPPLSVVFRQLFFFNLRRENNERMRRAATPPLKSESTRGAFGKTRWDQTERGSRLGKIRGEAGVREWKIIGSAGTATNSH